MANYKQVIIKVYDNVYALQNTYEPRGTTNRKGVIELVLAQNHYCLLLRWRT